VPSAECNSSFIGEIENHFQLGLSSHPTAVAGCGLLSYGKKSDWVRAIVIVHFANFLFGSLSKDDPKRVCITAFFL